MTGGLSRGVYTPYMMLQSAKTQARLEGWWWGLGCDQEDQ
jgi:hypothetical protein